MMVSNLEVIILLMTLAIVLVAVALKWRISYPIALVIGGSLLGFIPGISEIHFDPTFVLIIVLPPILYYSAYSIPFNEFKKNIQQILALALGLVAATTLVVGIIFKLLFPELSWALAFTVGALLSPPDAVSATAILKRFSISPRLIAVLEGESLINDASGLILYRLGVVSLLSGTFSIGEASLDFFRLVIGGVIIGIAAGILLHRFSGRWLDPTLAVVFSFVIPYLTYFAADFFDVSGVLAVVICGLIGSKTVIKHFTSLSRVIGWASWDIYTILLNCFIFILIGLQLHYVMARLSTQAIFLYLGYAFIITIVMIAVRFAWVYTRLWLVSGLSVPAKAYSDALILSWCSMRGIISLTAALALPFLIPERDIVIFLSFVVILLTLVIPGLTLAPLIHHLHIRYAHPWLDTKKAREELLRAAQEEMHTLYTTGKLDDQEYEFLLTYFKTRHKVLEIALIAQKRHHPLESARRRIIQRKRNRLLEMLEKNEINDKLFNYLEHELDLEESYLARAEI